ncbi:hypothetical protein [Streptomyces sp. NPDC001781]
MRKNDQIRLPGVLAHQPALEIGEHLGGVQAEAGTFSTCWWMASVMTMPTE